MQIDLRELLVKDSIIIDSNIDIPQEYLIKSEIKSLRNLKLAGKIYYSISEELVLDIELNGIMVLTDAYTLELVDYPFSIKIDEVYAPEDLKTFKNNQKNENLLDITDILWQNIVLEVPISYSVNSQVVEQSGKGWELVNNKEKKIDSRLAVLKELLEEGKE